MNASDTQATALMLQAFEIKDWQYIPSLSKHDESLSIADETRQALSLLREAYDIAQNPITKSQIRKSLDSCSNEEAGDLL